MLNKDQYQCNGRLAAIVLVFLGAATAVAGDAKTNGPLRVSAVNPRYFSDDSGAAVYLAGSHTWSSLIDRGPSDPPPAFDFDGYLDFLQKHNHNFVRLWAHELFKETNAGGDADPIGFAAPFPWARTGPGNAWDGKPKFDLARFDPAYFDRLRSRVVAARDRGIYVGIMFFKGEFAPGSGRGHPFQADNNINGISADENGDGLIIEAHTLQNPAVTDVQKAYIAKVIDTVNEFDNVLYEISNESKPDSRDWQYELVDFVHRYQAHQPKQHPVGMTSYYYDRDANADMFASSAEWVSPQDTDRANYSGEPPAADGGKVVLLDTDHLGGANNFIVPLTGADHSWVWKSFLRGYNPILMDSLADDPRIVGPAKDRLESARRAMGHTRTFANKMDLAAMTPRNDLSSTAYCLANRGDEYLIYQPDAGEAFSVDLQAGMYRYEWFDPRQGATGNSGRFNAADGRRRFEPPFAGEAVLYLKAAAPAAGPLRFDTKKPRYFTDGTGRAVYLTGSHTWPGLIDRGPSDPPPVFDFDGYLDFLESHEQNFIRLWARHISWYQKYGDVELHAGPLAWQRTGDGEALDGKPKFDLTKFESTYFDRLRSRVQAAGKRGIYVSVMLFGGYQEAGLDWAGNPFHRENNVNGIDGDPNRDDHGWETQTLAEIPAPVAEIQKDYIRKVIDTVNDLDNVLYEISNESGVTSAEWQYDLVRFIRQYERAKPQQHPIGMTAGWWSVEENRAILEKSPADWVSYLFDTKPDTPEGFHIHDPFVADAGKVSIMDSDHWWVAPLYGDVEFGRDWVWKGFCRGHNLILMEHLPPLSFVKADHPLSIDDPGYAASRNAMAQTRRFAERMNLAGMSPSKDIASSGYCLADPGSEYLVYAPMGGPVSVDVSAVAGALATEWLNVTTNESRCIEPAIGGQRMEFRAPFTGAAVLYLRAAD